MRPVKISRALVLAFAILTTVAPSLFPSLTSAATKCRNSDFRCFKRKMMPSVGRQITVRGILKSAKLGLFVSFDHWGIYIYALHDPENSKLREFESLEGLPIIVRGTLRYAGGSPALNAGELGIPDHFFLDAASISLISPRPAAEIEFREMRFRKPPLVEIYFDLTLRNNQSEARWFLLPSNLSPTSQSIGEKGGVDALEIFTPRGQGRVVIGHFLGTGGFQAMRLPAHAQVRLRRFPISFWGEPPGQLSVEVTIARELSIGGENAVLWFGGSPLSSARVDIAEDALSSSRLTRSRHQVENHELATKIEVDRRLRIPVSLASK